MKFFLQIFFTIIFVSNSVCLAADYYVSNTGDDLNTGDVALPWKTLQHAVDSIIPGDKIIVQSGTYDGFRIRISGESENICQIIADQGAIVEVNSPSPDSINNAVVEFKTNIEFWNIEGLKITNFSECAIYLNYNTDINLKNLEIYDSVCGIFIKNSEDVKIQNLYIHGNNGYSLEIENSNEISVFNCLMYNNKAEVVFYNNCSNFMYANNTVFNNYSTVPMFDFSDLNSDLVFVNNIVISQVTDVTLLTFTDFNDFKIDNNIYKGKFKIHSETGLLSLESFKVFNHDLNSFLTEPEDIFADYQNLDFSLQINSKAGELGIYYEEIYSLAEDFAGNPRINGYYPDPGAFESSDSINSDTDSDGLPNWWEHLRGLDFLDSNTPDEDDDLDDLTNSEEYQAGTLPRYGDTDADGFGDGDEKTAGTDPLDQYDTPDLIGITPATFDELQLRKWFKFVYNVVNSKGSLKFEIIDGSLPPGLEFSASQGKISGYPARPGTFRFVIQVTDADLKTDTQKVKVIVGLPEQTETSGCVFNPQNNGADFYFVMLFLSILIFTRLVRVSIKR